MATITTDTFLDSGTARTAGEAWTITDCTLTIRTDTRWHAGSTTDMTGSLGSLTCAGTIGAITIDGTKVRCIPFNSGTGSVPAIGTTIGQAGSPAVNAYLLGVWQNYASAPVAPGTAMPATGFIKIREKLNGGVGNFSAGAIGGIGATATGPDVTGWIEVVMDHGAKITCTPRGDFTAIGDWFYLGTTSGARGQTITYPSLGGSIHHAGLSIETAPGSDVYEMWPIVASTFYGSYISNDLRGKVLAGGNSGGSCTIGAGSVGFLPAAGCKIRMPNIILNQCAAASRGTNATHSTMTSRPTWLTSKYGNIVIDKVFSSWYFNFVSCGDVSISNSAIETTLSNQLGSGTTTITECAVSNPFGTNNLGINLVLQSGITLTNTHVARQGSTATPLLINKCSNITTSDCKFGQYSTSSSSGTVIQNSRAVTFTNNTVIGSGLTMSQVSDCTISGLNYCFNSNGATMTTGGTTLLTISNSSDVIFSNPIVGFGSIANQHPYGALFQTTGNIKNIRFREIGTPTTPLATGAGANNRTQYIWTPNTATPDNSIKFSRIFASDIPIGGANTTATAYLLDDEKFLNCGSYTTPWLVLGHKNCQFRGIRALSIGASWTNAPGTHFADYFTSATAGALVLNLGLPTTDSLTQFSNSIVPSAFSGFDDIGIKLVGVGDQCIYEAPYSILGHTSFQNIAPTIAVATNPENHTFEFDVDGGSGYSGTWKDLTAVNLSTQSISPTGFKIKFRITCTVASSSNRIGKLTLLTNSTESAQASNLYAQDMNTLTFTGLKPGSEVRCYTGTDPATAVEIGSVESTAGTTFSFSHSAAGSTGYIRIFALGYQPYNYDPYTYSGTDTSLLVQQVVDRNYVNP